MINWRVRIKNKCFWLSIIPAGLALVRTVAAVFGVQLELGDLGDQLVEIVNAAFLVMAILGIVVDPTTAGIEDSDRAMLYDRPHEDPQ